MIAPERREEFRRRTGRPGALSPDTGAPSGTTETLGAGRTARPSRWRWSAARCGTVIAGARSPSSVTSSSARPTSSASSTRPCTTGSPAWRIARCSRYTCSRRSPRPSATDEPRAVLVMDLDGFKQVNDTLGHDARRHPAQAGRRPSDRRAARQPTRLPGSAETSSRSCPETPPTWRPPRRVAWKIQQTSRAGFELDRRRSSTWPRASASPCIPSTARPRPSCCAAPTWRCTWPSARAAATRSSTRTQEEQTSHQLALLVDLRQCVAREELVLHYQPKIDLGTGEISGVEALDPLAPPHTRAAMPGQLHARDGAHRADRAGDADGCSTRLCASSGSGATRASISRWRSTSPPVACAASSDLPETVPELTAAWGTVPGRLTLELTEGALIEAGAPDVLARLHDMGRGTVD